MRWVGVLFIVVLIGCGGDDRKAGGSSIAYVPEGGVAQLEESAVLLMNNWDVIAQTSQGTDRFHVEVNCQRGYCRLSNPRLGYSDSITINDIVDRNDLLGSLASRSAGMINGVPLFQTQTDITSDNLVVQADVLGGWLQHNVFLVVDGSADYQSIHFEADFGISLGNPTGRPPSSEGLALFTYEGAMLGAYRGGPVRGNAHVEVEYYQVNSSPTAQVSFSNITGAPVSNLIWDRSIVNSEGRFEGDYYLKAHFFGPNAEEVGGTFDRAGIRGAFGARR